MKVLVACEESQVVCNAFRERGHEAYSCDILPCSGGHPVWHIQGDVLEQLSKEWDLIIGFPPCTYISNAGAVHLFRGKKLNQERYNKGLRAKAFFMKIYNSKCDKIAIENPSPSGIYDLPPEAQVIEPYYFGDPYKKRTLLWLKGLQPLIHNNQITLFEKEISHITPTHKWVSAGKSTQNGLKDGLHRNPKMRSKTFPGIANAMAEQWG